jgi:hypothetical protein
MAAPVCDRYFSAQWIRRPVAAAMGFVLDSKLLIIAGALDGSSGLILHHHVEAMNRSFSNVLFGRWTGAGCSRVARKGVRRDAESCGHCSRPTKSWWCLVTEWRWRRRARSENYATP